MKGLELFLKEFSYLYKQDKYISKKKIDHLFLKYDNLIKNINNIEDSIMKDRVKKIINNKDRIFEIKNEKFVNEKLIEYKEYFDNMFKGIDNNIILDEEQRRAILTDEDYSLVIAGAGSGKTTTMAAKVKYLVDKMHVKEDKIILLAFTNKACEELSNRINGDFKLNVEVLTFHKLGMKFLRQIMNKPIQIIGPGTFNRIIEEYITKFIFENKEKLKDFREVFDKYLYFDDKCLSYKTFNEYFDYYVEKTYELNKDNLKEYCDKRIKNRLNNYTSITGERFKSKAEVLIANYLYINSIEYKYEKLYPHTVNEGRSYSPDFTLPNNDSPLYIEYYGLSRYSKDDRYSDDEIEFYKKLIIKKRQLHEKYSTDLIELYSEYDYDTNYLKELEKSLNERFITKIKKNYREIFNKILYTSREASYFKVISLFYAFISRFKEKGNNIDDFDKYIDNCDDKLIKRQLKYLKEFYSFYEYKIHSDNKIDFSDMINYAYRYAYNLKNKNITYDYLIIDEYQDISYQRYNFARRISDLFNAKIVAVGDDWQAIYGFSGSDVDLFTKFYELMGYAEIIKIQKTYRNSQELLDVTTDFVSKDVSVFNKNLISDKHLNKPIELYYYDINNINSKYKCLVSIIEKIYNENNKSKILILTRFNQEKEELLDSKLFSLASKDKIICRSVLSADIDILTVHSSKGLGYDQVIILNGLNDKFGFPSQIEDEDLLKVLDVKKEDSIKYPEERRLFYVALTRTKNKVYILCPYMPMDKRSEFVKEIENNENVNRNLMVF